MDLQRYLDFAVETAYLAGRLTLGYFQAGVRPDYKKDDTPVTVADRLAEELIRQRIEQHFPNHAIVGEEYGARESQGSEFRWFIDPIDGTKAFVRGVPLYAVLIGLEIEGKPQAGAAYFPALNEMLAGATGLGAWWNGRRAHVSAQTDLSRAYVCFTDAGSFARCNRQAAWNRLVAASYYRAGWSDAYGYLLVATGRAEVMLDPIMDAWDCGPFPPIFAEAGGYFGDWKGNITIHAREAVATNHPLLPQVLPLLAD
jgi:myo-inositol-1(or 4)-monophosphatase